MGKAKAKPTLAVPSRESRVEDMVDWLEIAAILSSNDKISFGQLIEQVDLDIDSDLVDIAEEDLFRDGLIQNLAAEIRERSKCLEGVYPFAFSDAGQNFTFTWGKRPIDWVYAFTLILSHARKSSILSRSLQPSDILLREARDIFQVCATLAAAGKVEGPSFSIGFPRPNRVSFLAKLTEAWAVFGDGQVHLEIPSIVSRHHKDEGVDVLAFWQERDGGHSLGYLVGQAASGHTEWKDKSAQEAATILLDWFHLHPATKAHTATFIPFYVSADLEENHRLIRRHGYIVHRTRLAALVSKALALAASGIGPIERLSDLQSVQSWVQKYLKFARSRLA